MSEKRTPHDTLLVALITGLLTLTAALGSQWLQARAGLNTTKVQLLFQKKSDAYQRLLDASAVFVNTRGPNQTRELLGAVDAALVVSSEEVYRILTGEKDSVRSLVEETLRTPDGSAAPTLKAKWEEVNGRLRQAIRRDIQSIIH